MFFRRAPKPSNSEVHVPSLGTSFPVASKQTLLDGALRAKVDIPFSCRVGSCGTCALKLVSGRIKARTEFAYVLSERALADGYVLACQSVPLDAKLEIELGPTCDEWQPAELVQSDELGRDIHRVLLRPARRADYVPGQFIVVRPRGMGAAREYSLACAPQADAEHYELCVRRVSGGLVSSWLTDRAHLGASVEVTAPRGRFHYRGTRKASVFLAGGSGIGPIKAMLETLVDAPVHPRVHLFYGARYRSEIAYEPALLALKARWKTRFELKFVVSREAVHDERAVFGRVSDWLEEVAEVAHTAEFYVCGGGEFVRGVEGHVRALGVQAENVWTERFAAARRAEPERNMNDVRCDASGAVRG